MKKFLVFVALIVVGVFFAFSRPQKSEAGVVDHCDHTCPTFTLMICPSNDGAYTSHDSNLPCRIGTSHKHYAAKIDHSPAINVVYEKSEDPNKCHRPSDHDLDHEYGMSDNDIRSFKEDHGEWVNSIPSAPSGYYLKDGVCYPNPTIPSAPVCGNDIVEEGEQCDDANTNNGDGCSATCQTESPVDLCTNLDGNQKELPTGVQADDNNFCTCKPGFHEVVMINDVKTTVAVDGYSEFTCEADATPTETPKGDGFGLPGDGRSDGQSDGRSSCPECTAPPAGQVLGATTDFAGTGTAVDMLVNAIGVIGGLSTAAGLALVANKRS